MRQPTLTVPRWYTHIKSYAAEHGSLPGSSKAGEAFTAAAPAPAAAAEEDEEEVDLFGEDDEEDAEAEKLKADRVAAYNAKKAGKPKTAAKVRTIFWAPTCYSFPCIYRNFRILSLTGIFVCSLWSPST